MGNFTFIDLFAGIGGFHIALSHAGGELVAFSEIAPDAVHAYCENFNEAETKNLGDITKLKDLPEHDFLTAGVPCQSWSIAGKKLGFDDDRGQLWNDTLYLLNKARPKAFIFENVKGLADPRNKDALTYIMERIKESGYYAKLFVLNANDYGLPQSRVRMYIVGFREESYFKRFVLPSPCSHKLSLGAFLSNGEETTPCSGNERRFFDDCFYFNDLRDGETTIHSWDIEETTEKEKKICRLLLKNRRKRRYGILDGNALSLEHFKDLDNSLTKEDLEALVAKKILKQVPYCYRRTEKDAEFSEAETDMLKFCRNGILTVDEVKMDKHLKILKINAQEVIDGLVGKGVLELSELRYDFKNAKISTGINGVTRIFLKTSETFPTLVASDTNDYIATADIAANTLSKYTLSKYTLSEYKKAFLEKIYFPKKYRKITKEEACLLQGFPADFILPEPRHKWMKLIGNSVAVPVVEMLVRAVVNTGVFAE